MNALAAAILRIVAVVLVVLAAVTLPIMILVLSDPLADRMTSETLAVHRLYGS